jgi:hypothetical protein
VFLKDIFRVSIEIIDRDNRLLTKDFERVLIQDSIQKLSWFIWCGIARRFLLLRLLFEFFFFYF